jgi:hypothetical protein
MAKRFPGRQGLTRDDAWQYHSKTDKDPVVVVGIGRDVVIDAWLGLGVHLPKWVYD